MPKVLLIKPRRPLAHTGEASAPPLGLLYLAAYAREKRPGKDQFVIMDERLHGQSDEERMEYIRDLGPDCIGLSALSAEADRLTVFALLLKKHFPEIPLFLGGPHASSTGPKLLHQLPIDFLVMGEGERAFVRLLEMVEQGLEYPASEVSGLAYKDAEGRIVHWPQNTDLIDVKDLPLPAWDLIDIRDYQQLNHMTPFSGLNLYAPLMTSRGCPYRCIYCHEIFGKTFRTRTVAQVVDEMEHLIRLYGVHEFEVYDDVFNLSKKTGSCNLRRNSQTGVEDFLFLPQWLAVGYPGQGSAGGSGLHRNLPYFLCGGIGFHAHTKAGPEKCGSGKSPGKHYHRQGVGNFLLGIFHAGFSHGNAPGALENPLVGLEKPFERSLFFFRSSPTKGTALAREYATPPPEETNGGGPPDFFNAQASLACVGLTELWITQAMAYILFLTAPVRVYSIMKHIIKRDCNFFHSIYQLSDYLLVQRVKMLAEQVAAPFQAKIHDASSRNR